MSEPIADNEKARSGTSGSNVINVAFAFDAKNKCQSLIGSNIVSIQRDHGPESIDFMSVWLDTNYSWDPISVRAYKPFYKSLTPVTNHRRPASKYAEVDLMREALIIHDAVIKRDPRDSSGFVIELALIDITLATKGIIILPGMESVFSMDDIPVLTPQ